MKLPRPHIPIPVRIKVAQRQLREHGVTPDRNGDEDAIYLDRLLVMLSLYLDTNLFGPLELDHNPALINRTLNRRTGKYTPDANDPRYLVYRTKSDHAIKTRVRGDGAQLADLALRRKNKRIAKRILTGKRPKYGVRA